ncbi:MAG: hypothetical protein RBU30_11885 [Polyangia bacterium]|nr:hypothetical protein [Polyangia bacterium]
MSLFNVNDIGASLPPVEPRRRTRAKEGRSHVRQEQEAHIPVRVARVAQLLPGELREGASLHLVSAGQFSNFDLIEALLSYFDSPPVLHLATWSSSDSAVRQLARLRTSGRVAQLHSLMDLHASQMRTDGAAFLTTVSDSFGTTNIHAKVAALVGQTTGFVVLGSANLTRNPRIEAACITRSREVAAFHAAWIQACIRDGALLRETP